MSDKSGIQWTEATWNPVTGCSKVSQGCKNCYALRDWARLSAPRPKPNVYTGREFTDVMFHPERLDQPLRWAKPRRVFVNSMSDLFHEHIGVEDLAAAFAYMGRAYWHTFQVLTKRPEQMHAMLTSEDFLDVYRSVGNAAQCDAEEILCTRGQFSVFERKRDDVRARDFELPLPNVWLGVSVEDQETADERIPLLLQTPAAVRFVSYEPALGPVDFDPLWLRASPSAAFRAGRVTPDMPAWTRFGAYALDWVIVGGESGPKARLCDIAWIRSAVEQCKAAGVACFVKQTGTQIRVPRNDAIQFAMHGSWTAEGPGAPFGIARPADRKGGNMVEWPEDLRVREFPR